MITDRRGGRERRKQVRTPSSDTLPDRRYLHRDRRQTLEQALLWQRRADLS